MKHARADYDRIQDPAGLIPTDEPVFLIRGQDQYCISTLLHYRDLVLKDGGDMKIVHAINDHLQLVANWPRRKAPDMP